MLDLHSNQHYILSKWCTFKVTKYCFVQKKISHYAIYNQWRWWDCLITLWSGQVILFLNINIPPEDITNNYFVWVNKNWQMSERVMLMKNSNFAFQQFLSSINEDPLIFYISLGDFENLLYLLWNFPWGHYILLYDLRSAR